MCLVLTKGGGWGRFGLSFIFSLGRPQFSYPCFFLSDSGYPCFFIYENHYVSISQGRRVIILLFTLPLPSSPQTRAHKKKHGRYSSGARPSLQGAASTATRGQPGPATAPPVGKFTNRAGNNDGTVAVARERPTGLTGACAMKRRKQRTTTSHRTACFFMYILVWGLSHPLYPIKKNTRMKLYGP